MNHRHAFYVIGLFLVCVFIRLPAAIAGEPQVKATDALGKTVTLSAPASKVVSLAPSNTEILFAIGAGVNVAGVTSYCDYPAEAKKKPQIGDYHNPSLEKIVALKPDLVVGAHGNPLELVEELRRLGIPVFTVNSKTLDEVLRDIRTLGDLTGHTKDAEALVSSLQKRIDAVTSKTNGLAASQRPRTLFLGGWEPPVFTPGPGTFIHDLIVLAGGQNVAVDAPRGTWTQYSLEMFVVRAPEVLVGTYGPGDDPAVRTSGRLERLRTMEGWRAMPAVKQGRLGLVYVDAVLRPGPRLIDALEEMARIIHPELF